MSSPDTGLAMRMAGISVLARLQMIANPKEGAWGAERVAEAEELLRILSSLLLVNKEIYGALKADGGLVPVSVGTKILKVRLQSGWAAHNYGWFGAHVEGVNYRAELVFDVNQKERVTLCGGDGVWIGHFGPRMMHVGNNTGEQCIVFTDYRSLAEKRVALPTQEDEWDGFEFSCCWTGFRGLVKGIPNLISAKVMALPLPAEREFGIDVDFWWCGGECSSEGYPCEMHQSGRPKWLIRCDALEEEGGRPLRSPASAVFGGHWTAMMVDQQPAAAEGAVVEARAPSREALDQAFDHIHSGFNIEEFREAIETAQQQGWQWE